MSEVGPRTRHQDTLRSEISELLGVFSQATSADNVAFAVARSVCNLTRARSVVFIAALEGTDELSPLTIATYGSSSMFLDYEYWRATTRQGMNFGTFKSVAESFGWNDLESEYIYDTVGRISEGSKLYCRKVIDIYGIFTGFICIESSFNPFEYSGFEDALLVMSIGGLRFFQAKGQYGSQSLILQKIIHDANGALSVIGLQAELLKLKSNIENHFVEAEERIKSALEKADQNVRKLNEFSHLFYPEMDDADGYGSSSIPSIALSAAFSSLTLRADQIQRAHIKISVAEYERVRVSGIILYWIYRAILSAWASPYLDSGSGVHEILVDLNKVEGDRSHIFLSISRRTGLPVDGYINAAREVKYGAVSNHIMLIPPILILENIVTLFGGSVLNDANDQVRVVSIGFPCFE